MVLIRLAHPRHYDFVKNRFKSEAFRCSSNEVGGGASVISQECADKHSQDRCKHIDEFYPVSVSGDPAVYFLVSQSELPSHARVEQKDSPTGDKCHYNILGVHKSELRAIIKKKALSDFYICAPEGMRQLALADLEPFR